MKQLVISILLTGWFAIGYSQHISETSTNSGQEQDKPQMAHVKLKADYIQDMQKTISEKNEKSTDYANRKLKVRRLGDVKNSQLKYKTTTEKKPKQIIKSHPSENFGKGKLPYMSKTRSKNLLKRVEGYVPREEFVKIEGHPVYDPTLLSEILGQGKMLKAKSSKEE